MLNHLPVKKLAGVVATKAAQDIRVYGNLIRHNGHHGVSLEGLAPGQPDVNKSHLVENNHIHHCGRLVGHGYGVRISQSGHNKISWSIRLKGEIAMWPDVDNSYPLTVIPKNVNLRSGL